MRFAATFHQGQTSVECGMSWSDLPDPWQEAFGEAWTAVKAGSLPIGAIVTGNGAVVAHGRNSTKAVDPESPVSGNKLAHAELNALLQLRRLASSFVKLGR